MRLTEGSSTARPVGQQIEDVDVDGLAVAEPLLVGFDAEDDPA
jgi:hypothetical protein